MTIHATLTPIRFFFNEKKATQAAAYLLHLNKWQMSYMQLIKLLFLADRRALIKRGQPITCASIVSMDRGPVLSEVYSLINGERDGATWDAMVETVPKHEVRLKDTTSPPNHDETSRFERRMLDEVFAEFGSWDQWKLVDWLHDPKNIPEWQDPHGSMIPISFESILQAGEVPEADIEWMREEAAVHYSLGVLFGG